MIHKQLEHHEVMSKKSPRSYKKEVILFLDQLIIPSNIAGIFRLADAFQVKNLYLRGESDVLHSKKFRSIARTHEDNLNYKVLEESEIESMINFLKNQGFLFIGVEFTDRSTLLPSQLFSDKTVLVLGSESHGISKDLLSHCDECIHIPMEGGISSLNVATATGMVLYEIRRTEIK